MPARGGAADDRFMGFTPMFEAAALSQDRRSRSPPPCDAADDRRRGPLDRRRVRPFLSVLTPVAR